jgi:O-acetyl-ADP-ribose deacetylase (regulator of RNase III)
LQSCYRKSLEIAVENKLKSIAFSALSTGVYGYPSDEAAEAAIAEVKRFLDSGKGDSLEKIIFCNFLEKDETAYFRYLP